MKKTRPPHNNNTKGEPFKNPGGRGAGLVLMSEFGSHSLHVGLGQMVKKSQPSKRFNFFTESQNHLLFFSLKVKIIY